MEAKPRTVRRTADDYKKKLERLINFRNENVTKKYYRTSKDSDFDRDNYPSVDFFKQAISNTKGNIPDIAIFFKVPKHVVVHWLKSDEGFKDAFISYMINSQSNSLFITIEEMTSSIEWKMCVFETEMSPLDIKSNYLLTRNMAPIFRFKTHLYSFPFFKKYGTLKDIRTVRDKILTAYLQAKNNAQMRNAIAEFEKISGMSFQSDVLK